VRYACGWLVLQPNKHSFAESENIRFQKKVTIIPLLRQCFWTVRRHHDALASQDLQMQTCLLSIFGDSQNLPKWTKLKIFQLVIRDRYEQDKILTYSGSKSLKCRVPRRFRQATHFNSAAMAAKRPLQTLEDLRAQYPGVEDSILQVLITSQGFAQRFCFCSPDCPFGFRGPL
jgi:hypothetical protein